MTPKSPPVSTTGRVRTSPPARLGEVINYVYLFASQMEAGRDEGIKERPAIVLQADDQGYIVVAVTTKGETDPSSSIPIPTAVATALGLPDAGHSLVVVSEANSFDWMGHDVRERTNGSFTFGVVPPGFFAKIIDEVIGRRVKPIDRR